MAITVTPLGTVQSKTLTKLQLSLNSFTYSEGDVVILIVARDTTSTTLEPVLYGNSGSLGVLSTNASAFSNQNIYVVVYSKQLTQAEAIALSSGNRYVETETLSSSASMVAAAYKVSGLDINPYVNGASAIGTSGNPSSGSRTTSFADMLLLGAIGFEGPQNDVAGFWSADVDQYQFRNGTTGGGAASNITLNTAVEVVSSIGTYTASITGADSRDWGAVIATYKGGSSVPVLSPSGVSTSESFGIETITPGFVALSVNGVVTQEQFGATDIEQGISLPGIASEGLLGSPLISPQSISILSTNIPSVEQFGVPSILSGATSLAVIGVSSAETFGSSNVTEGAVALSIAGINSIETFGATQVNPGSISVGVTGTSSLESVGVLVISQRVELFPSGLLSNEAFGATQTIPGEVQVATYGMESYGQEGIPTLYVGSVAIISNSIFSEEQFGSSRLSLGLRASGILSAEAFDTAILSVGSVTIQSDDILSGEQFGNIILQQNSLLIPGSITGQEILGELSVFPGFISTLPGGIVTSEQFGIGSLGAGSVYALVNGVLSGEDFGSLTVLSGTVVLTPAEISFSGLFGTPILVVGAVTFDVLGTESQELVGTPKIEATSAVINSIGIYGQESIDAPLITAGTINLIPGGLSSFEEFGETLITTGSSELYVTGIMSQEVTGNSIVSVGNISLQPEGVSSVESLGTTKLVLITVPIGAQSEELIGQPSVSVAIMVQGIAEEEILGASTLIITETILTLSGIPTLEDVGVPLVGVGQTNLTVSGISDGETFGQAILYTIVEMEPGGVLSDELFGTTTIVPRAIQIGVLSNQHTSLVGDPQVYRNLSMILTSSIDSSEVFGTAIFTPDWGKVVYRFTSIQKNIFGWFEVSLLISSVLRTRNKLEATANIKDVDGTIVVIEKLVSSLKL